MMALWALVLPAAALVTWTGAVLARRYALGRRMVDEPGDRRSHEGAVPRGGGAGIPVVVTAAAGLAAWTGGLSAGAAIGVGGGLMAVGVFGWLEDHRPVPIPLRILGQAAAVAWLLWWTGGLASLDLGFRVPLGPAGNLVALLACVWLINLYNFMDGIDALAASEGVFVGAVMGAWFLLAGQEGAALVAWTAAAACAGFLPWNLPPARLFLGDAGSTSLGFVFAALALVGEQTGTLPAAVSIIVLGVFAFDATFTVLSRMLNRARWYTPHREHAYQYLVRAGLGHGRTVCRLMAVNLLVILPVVMVLYGWPALRGPAIACCAVGALALWTVVRRRCAAREIDS